jgi:hypothetical protein
MGIGKDGFLAVAPSAPPTPSRGIVIIIIFTSVGALLRSGMPMMVLYHDASVHACTCQISAWLTLVKRSIAMHS